MFCVLQNYDRKTISVNKLRILVETNMGTSF